jgi:hypothetical protein
MGLKGGGLSNWKGQTSEQSKMAKEEWFIGRIHGWCLVIINDQF